MTSLFVSPSNTLSSSGIYLVGNTNIQLFYINLDHYKQAKYKKTGRLKQPFSILYNKIEMNNKYIKKSVENTNL